MLKIHKLVVVILILSTLLLSVPYNQAIAFDFSLAEPTPLNNFTQQQTAPTENLKLSYKGILDTYPSLVEVKKNLLNLKVFNKSSSTTVSGYDVILDLLNGGYDGFSPLPDKEDYLNKKYNNYEFKQCIINTNPMLKLAGGIGGDCSYIPREYITRVMHALWLEDAKTMPWSLKNYSTSSIATLFWVNSFDNYDYDYKNYNFTSLPQSYYSAGHGKSWSMNTTSTVQLFLLANKLKGNNVKNSVINIAQWQKKNFFHIDSNWDFSVYKDTTGANIYGVWGLSPRNIYRLFEERATCCHLNAALLANLLRSLNIPAIPIIDKTGHGVTYIPSIDKYVHGDHIAVNVTILAEDMLINKNNMMKISDFVFMPNKQYDSPILKYIAKQYSSPLVYETSLHRSKDPIHGNDKLYIFGGTTSTPPTATEWIAMVNEVKEYNIKKTFDPITGETLITSDYLPIQTLEQLSI